MRSTQRLGDFFGCAGEGVCGGGERCGQNGALEGPRAGASQLHGVGVEVGVSRGVPRVAFFGLS